MLSMAFDQGGQLADGQFHRSQLIRPWDSARLPLTNQKPAFGWQRLRSPSEHRFPNAKIA
jgi:hypothetical protein